MTFLDDHTAIIADPHPLWLDAVEQVLSRMGITVVAKTTSPSEALDLVREHKPDILIAELASSDGQLGGLELLTHVRDVEGVRTVVLSLHHEPRHIDAALAAGAVAYVIKTAHPDDLASAIRQAFDHSMYLPGGAVTGRSGREAEEEDGPGLTRRELEILRLVAEGHSNAQLARMLWVTEQTVKFHLSNVYRKLNVSNRTEASRWAQLNGLLGTPAPVQMSTANAA
jgi:DNA-binding NarL/FixJ family response regulator